MSDETFKRRKAFISEANFEVEPKIASPNIDSNKKKAASKLTTKRVQIPLDSTTVFLLELLLINSPLKNYIKLG